MIDSTLQQDSRARSNTASLLALFLFLFLGLMAHGLFFPQEWIILGFTFSIFSLLSHSYLKSYFPIREEAPLGLTDSLFLVMVCFSLLGVVHAVKVKDGLIEALRWGIFWFVYRLGGQIYSNETAKKRLTQSVEGLAMLVACIGWVPWVTKVAGRLSSVFGYPNAMATFLGVALLLYPRRKSVRIFLGISLLATGSRAGVGLFLLVLMGQQFFLYRGKKTSIHRRKLWAILLGIVGAVLMLVYNRPAWENLTSWGFSSSSWQERLVYYKDGISLAWNAGGLPQAGGWLAFPTVQHFPYWTSDPHSSFIHILLNQGAIGIICVGIWSVFTLAQARKTWLKKCIAPPSTVRAEATKAEVRVWGALLFLALHSLVDADFSFGALGLLFWMLFGSFVKRDEPPRPFYSRWNSSTVYFSSKGMFFLSLILCLVCGSALLNPALIEKEKSLNMQARLGFEQNPTKSIALWNLSLNWDQTQITTRREQAELLLKRGNTDAGLKAVQEVLQWQPFELEAYEWAQSIAWDAAEIQRHTHPEIATKLYRWVEGVPKNIEERVAILTLSERLLWQGYREFQASPHIKLLAEYARQRQLTQPLPGT